VNNFYPFIDPDQPAASIEGLLEKLPESGAAAAKSSSSMVQLVCV
jgi:hypothetical protein